MGTQRDGIFVVHCIDIGSWTSVCAGSSGCARFVLTMSEDAPEEGAVLDDANVNEDVKLSHLR